jgi:hypothetical protein
MQSESIAGLPSLQLYILQHPDRKQAAWVRASTPSKASTEFSNKTDIPIIVQNDHGWVLFPEGRQHTNDEKQPVPHWEYLETIRGQADLRGFPDYIRSLGEKRAPRGHGQVIIGRAFTRPAPTDSRSIPEAAVTDTQVFHSGYPRSYSIAANEMFGYRQDWASVEIGKVAVLELADENAESPQAGDIVKVNLRGSESDHIVTGKVVGKSLLVYVVIIEKQR